MTTIEKNQLELFEQAYAKLQDNILAALQEIAGLPVVESLGEKFFKKDNDLVFDEPRLEQLRTAIKSDAVFLVFMDELQEQLRKFLGWLHHQLDTVALDSREQWEQLQLIFKVDQPRSDWRKEFQICFDKKYFEKTFQGKTSQAATQKINDYAFKAVDFFRKMHAKVSDLQAFMHKCRESPSEVKLLVVFLEKLVIKLKTLETIFNQLKAQNWQSVLPNFAETLWVYQLSKLKVIKTNVNELELVIKQKFANAPTGAGVNAADQATVSLLQQSTMAEPEDGLMDEASKILLADLVREDPGIVFKNPGIFKMVQSLSQDRSVSPNPKRPAKVLKSTGSGA
jgi:hypothetical protein